jgi:hypothetical protein
VPVELHAELESVVAAAAGLARSGEEVAAVIPTEPEPDVRVYLCAYSGGPARTWAAVDGAGQLLLDRRIVRAAVSIAALCELVALRVTENPEGIEEAEAAALDLERTIEQTPRLASPAYLDAVGTAVRRLELALSDSMTSPVAEAMTQGSAVVRELELEVAAGYKGELT